jgi:hypothetical protein
MRGLLVLVLLAGSVGILASHTRAPVSTKVREHHFIGERASLKVPFYGCTNPDDESRVVSLAEHDFDAGIRRAIRAGCHYFNAGDVGIIKSSSGSNNHVCVRQGITSDCYWISATLLE